MLIDWENCSNIKVYCLFLVRFRYNFYAICCHDKVMPIQVRDLFLACASRFFRVETR